MEIGWISSGSWEAFHTLLLPDAAQAIHKGLPVLALGLTEGDTACGAAAGMLRGETFLLQSFYVAPEFRRRGGGRLLMDTLRQVLQGHCRSVEIHYTITQPDHEGLAPFLTALGFSRERDQEETLYALTVGKLKDNSFFAKRKPPTTALPFEQVPHALLAKAYQAAQAKGEAYLPVPLTDPSVDQAVSMALLDKKAVRSFVAFVSPRPGLLNLAWVQSGHPQDVPVLLLSAFAQGQVCYPPETLLTIQAVTPAAAALIQALIPEAESISRTYYYTL